MNSFAAQWHVIKFYLQLQLQLIDANLKCVIPKVCHNSNEIIYDLYDYVLSFLNNLLNDKCTY